MEIIITAWALDSYLDLKHKGAFSPTEYKNTIRPDTLLLKKFPNDPKFQNGKFWGLAKGLGNVRIPDGFKMKWHQIGPGKVQLRLPVGILTDAFLCGAYIKKTPKQEQRKLEVFRTHMELIRQGNYIEAGRLK